MTSIQGFKGDIYQAGIITKYELIKHFRSKKLYIFLILLGLVFGLTLAVFISMGFPDTSDQFIMIPMMICSFIMMIAAVLFAATALVSEFEERTALLMFTRPVRKSTIVAGKFMASTIMTFAMAGIYFLVSAIISLAKYGEVNSGLPAAFAVALAGGLCYMGMAFLFSSFSKKGSTASLLTLVMNLIIISMITALLGVAAPDTTLWFMPDYAMDAVFTALNIHSFNMGYAEVMTSIGVLVAWAAGTLGAGYVVFRRREF